MAAFDVSAKLKERCLVMDGAMGTMLQKQGMHRACALSCSA